MNFELFNCALPLGILNALVDTALVKDFISDI